MSQKPFVVGVVGLGSVGEPLLGLVRTAGHEVIGVERSFDVLARVGRRLKAVSAEAGWDDSGATLTPELSALERADVVFEATSEDLAGKAELLRRLDEICPDHTVFVTATASLPLHRLAVASRRPNRTLGLRLLRPPTHGASVEPVPTEVTSSDALSTVSELVTGAGLTPTAIGAGPAEDAATLVYAYLNRAVALVEQGYASQDDVDTAMRLGCGLPVGPLKLLDEMGLDQAHAALSELHARTGNEAFRPASLLGELVRGGTLGRKTGQGFHHYDDLGASSQTSAPPAADAESSPVQRVGIVGSGTMARGIAEVTAVAGLPTILVARSRGKVESARESVETSLTKAVRRGRISPETKASALARVEGADDVAVLADCDVVIEATAEELAVKKEVFARLGEVCRPGALLATTTSSLSVTACAEASGRQGDVLGLHFFNPAPAMRLVELVRTPMTGNGALATARSLCARLGKTSVECPDRAGFIVNYLLFPYLADAIRLLDRPGTGVAETDAAVERCVGFPVGPFALLDTIGLDVSLAILQRLHEEFSDPAYAPSPMLEQLVAQGHWGRKSGQGFLPAPRRGL
ncbi:3-hydroxyacyl-CoA dehydrogenase family protein [Streptomyces sulphureus]|uniref:3-hydroxyacyl-CoA dehydrogenase family protein n=1 Tax=Streptomyces sulphureus TaxID=47758 RepID=UPI00039B7782|nr:3-hydroxyacyl-CoA dehydrogenase family protein [Streptomyces sulphureus]